jgi:hypothetical protein
VAALVAVELVAAKSEAVGGEQFAIAAELTALLMHAIALDSMCQLRVRHRLPEAPPHIAHVGSL